MDTCIAHQNVRTATDAVTATALAIPSKALRYPILESMTVQHDMAVQATFMSSVQNGLLTRYASAASCKALTAATCHRLSFSVPTDSVISLTSL